MRGEDDRLVDVAEHRLGGSGVGVAQAAGLQRVVENRAGVEELAGGDAGLPVGERAVAGRDRGTGAVGGTAGTDPSAEPLCSSWFHAAPRPAVDEVRAGSRAATAVIDGGAAGRGADESRGCEPAEVGVVVWIGGGSCASVRAAGSTCTTDTGKAAAGPPADGWAGPFAFARLALDL